MHAMYYFQKIIFLCFAIDQVTKSKSKKLWKIKTFRMYVIFIIASHYWFKSRVYDEYHEDSSQSQIYR